MSTKLVLELEPAQAAPPEPMKKHVVDKWTGPNRDQVADRALCGFLWDRLNVAPTGELCQECAAELVRRGHL